MFDRTRRKVKGAARAAALTAAATVLFAVAAAFLTVASWAALAPFYPTTTVALIIGGVYLAFGLLLLAMAKLGQASDHAVETDHSRPPQHQPPPDVGNAVVQSFLVGMSAGKEAADRRH